MLGRETFETREIYLNPVYPSSFPDPFVLKHRGQYFGYCTGDGPDGRVFRIIKSEDLVSWETVGGAMEPIKEAPPFYWAPEVTYDNGKFYLYYSAGNETLMHLRVAVSERPDGGFLDLGRVLTSAEFAIDPHVFIDSDGSRFMFYATDFLEHSHIGTGTVVDRMNSWFELEGNPRPVTRAKYDWQVYDPQRHEKGGVRWHTVEGPSVLKRKNRYFEMFSGGNWQNTTYGVSFAISDEVITDREWKQFSDGENVLPILRTVPGLVVGPGHNSVVRGPNNRELYCVYHYWTDAGRVMAIDRMDFTGDRIFVTGATYTPQPGPYRPAISDLFAGRALTDEASSTGRWRQTDGAVFSALKDICERVYPTASNFICEFTFRCTEWKGSAAAFGFRLAGDGIVEFRIIPATRAGSISIKWRGGQTTENFYLPLDFLLPADHLIRVECDGRSLKIRIDSTWLVFETLRSVNANSFAIFARSVAAEFAGLTITEGFEDLFDSGENDLRAMGWKTGGTHKFAPDIRPGEVVFASDSECRLTKVHLYDDAEFAANLRADTPTESEYGIQLLGDSGKTAARLVVVSGTVRLEVPDTGIRESVPLPANFDSKAYHQFRLLKSGGRLFAALDETAVAEVLSVSGRTRISIFCQRTSAAVEMVRATAV